MNGYNFTERVRKVLALAREAAARMGHDHVAPEHMMLGLLREGEGVAVAVLQNLGADLDEVTTLIEERMLARERVGTQPFDLPYTSQAKKVLELSMREAEQLNHSYVGTEHLLLGFLRVGNEAAREVFENSLGISLEKARAETLGLLGAEGGACSVPGADRKPAARLEIEIKVRYPDGRVDFHTCSGRMEALRTIASL